MSGALLTDRSVREFREWLATMPRSQWERRVTGACDASITEGGDVPKSPRYSAENVRKFLQFIARKLPAADVARCWELVAPHIDYGDRAPRRNGHS
jgi:hypothetical protein